VELNHIGVLGIRLIVCAARNRKLGARAPSRPRFVGRYDKNGHRGDRLVSVEPDYLIGDLAPGQSDAYRLLFAECVKTMGPDLAVRNINRAVSGPHLESQGT
jgi:hypothetical protein